jgi:adenine deaminase
VRRGVARGLNLMHLLRVACLNPVRHYGLDVGLLREGDPADFIEVDSLTDFRVLRTFLAGQLAAEDGQACFAAPPCPTLNRFVARPRKAVDFRVPAASQRIRVIQAVDGELVTGASVEQASILAGAAVPDTARDLLKLAVVNRYYDTAPAVAFIRGFGLKHGALASSVAHDCHNIVAVGSNDEDLCQAVNLVIQQQGGLAVAAGPTGDVLPLPVAGLMSTAPCPEVARHYARLDGLARQLGCTLRAPFMTLSFMALLVIPALKLSDRGLFDGRDFALVPLFV